MIPELRKVQETPDREGVVDDPFDSLLLRVAEESAEEVGVRVLDEFGEVDVRELEGAGELQEELVDAVEPLQKDRTALVLVVTARRVPATVGELVAEGQPFPFYQDAEALRINNQLIRSD